MLVEQFQAATSPFQAACGADPSSQACRNFVNARITEITGDASMRKQNALATTYEYLFRTTDMDQANAALATRNNNMASVKDFIKSYNDQLKNASKYDEDASKRQFEINEYYYQNKLETLFFLQLFFISGLIMAILIYLNNRGFLTPVMTGTATMLLFFIVLLVGVTRYFYTKRTRDNRLWHRRYFGTEGTADADLLKCPGPSVAGDMELDINALIDPSKTQCLAEINDQAQKWFDQANQETKNYMETGAPVSSLFGSSLTVPGVCKK
jgi:hypothetical protein